MKPRSRRTGVAPVSDFAENRLVLCDAPPTGAASSREPVKARRRPAGSLSYAGAWRLAAFMAVCGWLCSAPMAKGFALLGPFAPWMTAGVGYPDWARGPGMDIGGPMALGEEYRWNIPVLTYGFDQSFLDYFGQGGVDAVEQAIQVLNDLPPTSSMVITNYPFSVERRNYKADALYCADLKSVTLSMLLEQMGLTAPVRNCYILRRWDPIQAQISVGPLNQSHVSTFPWLNNCVEMRNYDPASQLPSWRVNSVIRTWQVFCLNTEWIDPWLDIEPSGYYWPYSVSESIFSPGVFYPSLAQDDVGGLLYLYSSTNVNVECLDDSVGPVPGGDCIRIAPRPGVEKITFARHPTDSTGGFMAWTNQFADAYFTDGLLATQQVKRVVANPDFLFSAEDTGLTVQSGTNGPTVVYLPDYYYRTDTSRWTNGNVLNGNPDGDGPGVIRPPVKITFAKPGRYVAAAGGIPRGTSYSFWQWASFTTGTNVVIFPGNETNLTSLTLSTRLVSTNGADELEWTLFGREGANYRIEASADLAHWTTNSVLTNATGIFQFRQPADGPHHFFRAVLEDEPPITASKATDGVAGR